MVSYILPSIARLSLDRRRFPLLADQEKMSPEEDFLYPRVIVTPGQGPLPLFNGGIVSEEEIDRIALGVASSIGQRHAGRSILLVTILDGAIPFADLVCGYLAIQKAQWRIVMSRASIKVRSYGVGCTAREHRIVQPLSREDGGPVGDFHPFDTVILVDDLIDSGDTIAWLKNSTLFPTSATIEACFMLEKERRRSPETERTLAGITQVIGKKVPDEWVVGFGLDIAFPGSQQGETRHLFRGSLPGGIYAFNSGLESSLATAFQEDNRALTAPLQIYQSPPAKATGL